MVTSSLPIDRCRSLASIGSMDICKQASKWTPDELGRQQSSIRDTLPLLSIRSSNDRHFRFTNMERAYASSKALSTFRPSFDLKNMTLHSFIDAIERPSTASSRNGSKEYLYFSDGIGVIASRGLDLLPEANLLSPSGNIEDCDTNIWLGQPHVVTMPHYDSSYNLFVQIYGRKR
jgi:hypothetical protein